MSRRASALPDAEMCGLAPALAEQHPRSGRAALMGVAYHARCEASPGLDIHMARLTPEEKAEIAEWKAPASVCWSDEGVVLEYADALKEFVFGLSPEGKSVSTKWDDASGRYVRTDPGPLLVGGRGDMGWVKGKTVYAGDIKTGQRAIKGGPLSLQIVASALALADHYEADWFRCGIWYAREGKWDWSEPIATDSDLAAELWTRVKAAATTPPIAVVGSHCPDCFERAHCPAFTLPVSQAETALAPLTKPGGLTADNFHQAHLVLQAMSKLVDTGKETLKAWLKEHGTAPTENGKEYYLQERAGREYADVALLKADGLTKYIKQARPSEVVATRKT